MTRLPFITNENLDADQQAVWDNVTNGSRGGNFVGDHGGLIGPFNAPLHAAGTGKNVVVLGESLRFSTELDNRLLELAVSMVGAHWRSNFEWMAHSRLAIKAGISEEVIAAIEKGETPSFSKADEQAVHDFTSHLLADGRVSDDIYNAAQAQVGDRGMVELAQLIGYYCLVSLTLNTFQIELPEGNQPAWPY